MIEATHIKTGETREYRTQTEASRDTAAAQGSISLCVRGRQKSSKGWRFRVKAQPVPNPVAPPIVTPIVTPIVAGHNLIPPPAPIPPNAVETFVRHNLRFDPGSMSAVTFKEFYRRFIDSLPLKERGEWSRLKVSRALPEPFTTARNYGNRTFILRAAWASSAGGKAF